MFTKEAPKAKNSGAPPSLNMISEGTRIKGEIQSDNDIRIAGNLNGQADSKGKVMVTSSGHVEGNVQAQDADIAGKIDGELFISGKLVLRKSAVIDGDIHTKTLLVEEGAKITGNCKMGASNSTPASLKNGSQNSKHGSQNNKPVKEGAV